MNSKVKNAMENGTLPGGGGRFPNGHDLIPVSSSGLPEYHPGGRKRLIQAVEEFQLTMQHALRQDVYGSLLQRAEVEASVLPKFSALEMFDYLVDSDDEFYNWLFPYCGLKLSKANMSPMHVHIVASLRMDIAQRTCQDEEIANVSKFG